MGVVQESEAGLGGGGVGGGGRMRKCQEKL